jgi:hypothetical protein
MRGLVILAVMIMQLTACNSQTVKPTILKLDEFTIEFVEFASYDKRELKITSSPYNEILADLGETIESSIIKISSEILDKIELEQRIETSVTIMNEGPHCDLIHWKHFTSDWKKLKEESKWMFKGNSYTNGEDSKFPTVDMKELVAEANRECGQIYAELAKSAKSPNDNPCVVTVSRYFIKVKGVNKRTRRKFETIITVKMPMGC